jgi:ribonuclease P protein component
VPKHGHKIVERNLVKRRLREIGRRWALPALTEGSRPADLLVRAKKGAYEVEFSVLEAEVMTAVEAWCSGEL